MDNIKIKVIKENIRKLNHVYDLGIILIDELTNLIDLLNKYRRELSKRKSYNFAYKLEDDYVFDLIYLKVNNINVYLERYINSSIGLSGIGYLVDDLKRIELKREIVKNDKFQNEVNSITILKLNKELRDLRAKIDFRQKKIEWLEKKNMDRIKNERDLEKFDKIIEKIEKLGNL